MARKTSFVASGPVQFSVARDLRGKQETQLLPQSMEYPFSLLYRSPIEGGGTE